MHEVSEEASTVPISENPEAREQVREGLVDIAELLVKKYGLTIPEARDFIREMLTVSI